MSVDEMYQLWIAALARGNQAKAREHAEYLLWCLSEGKEPDWSEEARVSFQAWCYGAKARRRRPRV
jgi:hypothetical protein